MAGDDWCRGRNDHLQLGAAGPDSPVPVLAATQVSAIAAGLQTAIGLRLGSVVRWGFFADAAGHPPTILAGGAGLPVTSFAANDLSCLRLVDGQVYCFDQIHFMASSLDTDVYSPVAPVVE